MRATDGSPSGSGGASCRAAFATVEPLLHAESLDIYAAGHACLMLALLLWISQAWDLYRRLQRAKIASKRTELVASARE